MLVTSVTYVAGWVIGDLALRRRLGALAAARDARAGARAWPRCPLVAGLLGWLVLNVTDDLLGTSAGRVARHGC